MCHRFGSAQFCYAEFPPVVTGSSAVPMPSSTNDRVELVDIAHKRGPEPLPSSPSDSHGCKRPHTDSAPVQQGPLVTSSGSSSHKLNMLSDEESGELPAGVVNIFPTHNDQSRCCCPTQPQRTTLASCDVAQVFVSQYIAENLAYLQEREQREFLSESPTPNRASKTSSAQSTLSSFTPTSREDEIASKLVDCVSPPPGEVSEAQYFPINTGATKAAFLEKCAKSLPKQPWVTAQMRTKLVCWLFEVTMDYSISDEAFHLAISILDRVLRSGVTAAQYQAKPDCNWEADFFCVRTRELQALGWYVFTL